MKNPLNDKEFLKQLDLVKKKETYIRLESLNWNEDVVDCIEGRSISGSINIDGDSNIRRTCSLSLITEDISLNNYYWGLNTKIRIYIGLKNTINSTYPDIIWFKQGTFVLTQFSANYSVSSYTINLSAQDKMCMLNGTIGGSLPASIDFKQQVINQKYYEKVDLGPEFISDLYQVIDEQEMRLAEDTTFDSSIDYYERIYQEFIKVDISKEEYDAEDESFEHPYYVINPSVYTPYLGELNLQYILDNNIKLYIKEKVYDSIEIESEEEFNEQEDSLYVKSGNSYVKITKYNSTIKTYYYLGDDNYTPIELSNTTAYTFDKNITYYVGQEYDKVVLNEDEFEEFNHYYIKNENGQYIEQVVDINTFESFVVKGLYVNQTYTPSLLPYNANQTYFSKTQGEYKKISLNNLSYVPNKYFYKHILSYTAAPSVFDKNQKYFDANGQEVKFLENAYSNYYSNKYYIKNADQDDFILYDGEYNPNLTYYEQKYYSNKEDIPIKIILKEAIHTYGREPYHNIIINDVDDEGLLLKEYVGDTPLYLLVNNGICENIASDTQECYVINGNIDQETVNVYSNLITTELNKVYKQYTIQEIDKDQYENIRTNLLNLLINSLKAKKTIISDDDTIIYNSFVEEFNLNPSQIFFITDSTMNIKIYTVLKLTKGDAAGYELTDLTYPYDLISSPGEALTSILDKIKDTLQNYEYFYDVDGHFVWQRKKTYLDVSWNNIITNEEEETYVDTSIDTSAIQYSFEDTDLIISINHNVKLDNLKNDYSVWGTKKTINDVEVPIHARFAIDQKPYAYVTFPKMGFDYVAEKDYLKIETIQGLNYLCQEIYVNKDFAYDVLNLEEDDEDFILPKDKLRIEPTQYFDNMYAGIYYTYIYCDWREIIYQMALDYYKHNQENDFLAKLSEYNRFDTSEEYYEDNYFMDLINKNNGFLYLKGVTGYEQYYEDMEGFWRDLYNPNPEVNLGYEGGYYLNKEWQGLITDYSQFNCDYYLPLSEQDKYSKLIDDAINNLTSKIDSLTAEIEAKKEDKDFQDLTNNINNYMTLLAEEKEKKNNFLKSYYTQQLFVFNDPEYKNMLEKYSDIQQEKNETLNEMEENILSIIKNDFGLQAGTETINNNIDEDETQEEDDSIEDNSTIVTAATSQKSDTSTKKYKKYKMFRQADKRWRKQKYGTGRLSGSGCGPTSIAILVSSFNDKITPKDTGKWLASKGYAHKGTKWAGIGAGLKHFGFSGVTKHSSKACYKKKGTSAEKSWRSKMRTKKYVGILNMGNSKGHKPVWTTGGHYIAIVDYKKSGGTEYYYVLDPGSRHNDGWFKWSAFSGYVRNFWSCKSKV